MSDTTPVDVEPYDLDWLAPDGRIREIVTRYNNPDSPQRKMLATLDLVWDRKRELEAIVRDLAALSPTSLHGEPTLHGEWNECELCGESSDTASAVIVHRPGCPWLRATSWVSAHPVSGDQP